MPQPGDHLFIVGGTSGLGLALARAAHARGARVTIAGRGAARAQDVARDIGPHVRGVAIDLEDSAAVRAAFEGDEPIDHLVLTPVHHGVASIRDFDAADAARALRVKAVGFAEAVHHALPRLGPDSSIVLFGGLAKARPYPGSTMVTIANAALDGLVRTMAVELAPIRVNGLSPGLVEDSPRWRRRIDEGNGAVVDAWRARTPTRRLPTVDDIVHGAFFLMDNRAANGIDLPLDGGIQLG